MKTEKRSLNKASFFWVQSTIVLFVQSILEESEFSLFLGIGIFVFSPLATSIRFKSISFFLVVLGVAFGPFISLFGLVLLLLFSELVTFALFLFNTVVLVYVISPYVIFLHGDIFSVSFASLAALFLPIGIPIVSFLFVRAYKTLFLISCLCILEILLLLFAYQGAWFSTLVFTNEIFRACVVLIPVFFTFLSRVDDIVLIGGNPLPIYIPIVSLSFGMVCYFIPSDVIKTVVFDESHGSWETVKSSYGPDDFGRSKNYTYSLLKEHVRSTGREPYIFEEESDRLPDKESILIVKMPVLPFSNNFAFRLNKWVAQGGRLLIIADHTNLYDSTFHLNNLISDSFGFRLDESAVFDKIGMQNSPKTHLVEKLFGRINANGEVFPWLTGTGFKSIPIGTHILASYGMSFSEPADYSNQNRFGFFEPNLNLPYANHPSMAARKHGDGLIIFLLDSTPWSNFSIWKKDYKDLFYDVLSASEKKFQLMIAGYLPVLIGLVFLFLIIIPRSLFLFYFSLVLLGGFIGASMKIALPAKNIKPKNEIRIILGTEAKTVFLSRLVDPGYNNFSRIISSLSKYEYSPVALGSGVGDVELKLSKKWLVIEPDFDQLPAADDVLKHLSDGNNICVLFAKKQSTNKNIKNWLYRLGLNLSKTTALAIAEDVHPKWEDGLFRRRGYGLIKDTRVVTIPSSTGMLKGQVSDSMLQTYTVRPTNFPRTSGIFLVGFSSDQFSDDVVGDVWEGIYPSSVGKLRERQLASRISGVEGGNVFPEDLFIPKTNSKYLEKLDKFALIKDGFLKIKGEVVDVSVSGNDGMYEPWIFDIWNRVGALLSTSCPTKKMVTRCEKRLLDSNALEWIVTRVDKGGKLVAVELLHERRFSNIGASWNVVFSD